MDIINQSVGRGQIARTGEEFARISSQKTAIPCTADKIVQDMKEGMQLFKLSGGQPHEIAPGPMPEGNYKSHDFISWSLSRPSEPGHVEGRVITKVADDLSPVRMNGQSTNASQPALEPFVLDETMASTEQNILTRVVNTTPRAPREPMVADDLSPVRMNGKSTDASQPSLEPFVLDEATASTEQNMLTRVVQTSPRTPREPMVVDDLSPVRMNGQNTNTTQPSLESFYLDGTTNLTGVDAATQTDTAKSSAVNRYGALVASSLAAILGAVLVIVAKTHSHDEMEIDEAGDLLPQEPDYDAIGQQAAQDAEQAFYDKWHDPEMWGPGKVGSDGANLETGEKNPYFEHTRDQDTGEYYIGDNQSPEGERTLSELRETAAKSAVTQAKAEYEQALEEATAHNSEHASGTLRDDRSGKDHDAMVGVGATLIGLGGLAATLVAGNKLTHRSHDKQQAQGITPEHGPLKNFVEQKLFQVRA